MKDDQEEQEEEELETNQEEEKETKQEEEKETKQEEKIETEKEEKIETKQEEKIKTDPINTKTDTNNCCDVTESNKVLVMLMKKKDSSDSLYKSIINTNPMSLFDSITEETINAWKKIIFSNKKNNYQLEDDSELDNKILNCSNDYDSHKLVMQDVPRTRIKETKIYENFAKDLEKLINFYCKDNHIKYKQGLNEIIGGFLLLKVKLKNILLSTIYKLLKGFINIYATNYFYEQNCFSLKNSLTLLTILLKYHDPELYNIFQNSQFVPEMYGTNWLLTVFAGKLNLDLLYIFWNKLIIEDDPLMIHFLIVALLKENKHYFLKVKGLMIPPIFSKICLYNAEDINNIFNIAFKLRTLTPYSFRKLANKLEIFKCHCKNPKRISEKYKPEILPVLPIFSSEIFYICYNGVTKCPFDYCKNNIKNKENFTNNKNYLVKCENCDMKIEKKIQYILLDLRILEYGSFEKKNEKSGFLPTMIMVEQKELKYENFAELINQRFEKDKGNFHFVFMTSDIDALMKYIEENTENFTEEKKTNKNKYKLKEYNNFKNLLNTLLENNYPYISFIYGGFESLHEEIKNYGDEICLLNHDDKKCDLCKKEKKLQKAKTHTETINTKDLQKINDESNLIQLSMDEVAYMYNSAKFIPRSCRLIEFNDVIYKEQATLVILDVYLVLVKMSKITKINMVICDKFPLAKIKNTKIKDKLLSISYISEIGKNSNFTVEFEKIDEPQQFMDECSKAKLKK